MNPHGGKPNDRRPVEDFQHLLDQLTDEKTILCKLILAETMGYFDHQIEFLATSLRTNHLTLIASSGNRPSSDTNVGWQ